jgi:RNA polymerase sigma-70 factor (ECF subfamily)
MEENFRFKRLNKNGLNKQSADEVLIMKAALARPVMAKENPHAEISNAKAFDIDFLFQEYKDYVYSVALYLCRSAVVAEDLTQTVFLKVLKNKNEFRGEAEIKTWLYRIVFNSYIDIQRSTRRLISLQDKDSYEDELITSERPDHALLQKEVQHQVRRAVCALTPKLRVPLVLRYIAGLSYAEIAAVLETTVGTVASRISRAHNQLAEKLEISKRTR